MECSYLQCDQLGVRVMLLGTGCHLTWTIHTHGDDVAAATIVNPIDEQALEQFTKSGLSKGHLRCLSAVFVQGRTV